MPALDYYKRRCYLLETALMELVGACEIDAGVPGPDDDDDEAVGAGKSEGGQIKPMALTFGMMRRARKVLNT